MVSVEKFVLNAVYLGEPICEKYEGSSGNARDLGKSVDCLGNGKFG